MLRIKVLFQKVQRQLPKQKTPALMLGFWKIIPSPATTTRHKCQNITSIMLLPNLYIWSDPGLK